MKTSSSLFVMTVRRHWAWILYLALLNGVGHVQAVELTFELPDNAKECFHEVIEKGTESTLEFQVLISLMYISLS